eukprot:CAMPEP_0179165434 /NCGR_PEP_ID=MMETSP0796-20121207/81253_1 /TAXON_ID=73915 /ORGANISM="Pyrodinium bahamense, Strain pbaha01" /LENGTH=75 /DNA_ID=CAMNT_0020867995 /DNA_START=61 /DNA_END=285 /DNA_ORIENTATION=-
MQPFLLSAGRTRQVDPSCWSARPANGAGCRSDEAPVAACGCWFAQQGAAPCPPLRFRACLAWPGARAKMRDSEAY